jgi:putative aldouronate transport system substrate-binding protein
MKLVPPFKGPNGAAWSPYRTYNPTPIAYITYKATDPDFAFEFLESFYDHDLSLIGRFGREGVDWSRDPKDLAKATNAWVQAGVYPMVDLVQTETNIWGTPSNVYWRMTIPCYRDVKWMDNRATIGAAYDANYYGNLVNPLKYEYYVPAHPTYLIPQIKYSAANQERITEPQTNVQTYVNQAIAEFITNNAGRDINNNAHWQSYLDELNKMGLQTWVSTTQSTFDQMPK